MTQRNVPQALVDCNCEVTVYDDGSGVEIHYCHIHLAAPDLLEALKGLISAVFTEQNEGLEFSGLMSAKLSKASAAVRKVESFEEIYGA